MPDSEEQKIIASKGREKQATEAYLKFLQSKGASNRMLYLRSRFLDTFATELVPRSTSRKEYASALSAIQAKIASEDKSHALNTAREFFPFWMNDIKAIAKFESNFGFDTTEMEWEPRPSSLTVITTSLNKAQLSLEESLTLESYTKKLQNSGTDHSLVKKYTQLAKIILICLRGAPETSHVIYRKAVDMTLPLFKTGEIKRLYLQVVREFYYIWKETSGNQQLA